VSDWSFKKKGFDVKSLKLFARFERYLLDRNVGNYLAADTA